MDNKQHTTHNEQVSRREFLLRSAKAGAAIAAASALSYAIYDKTGPAAHKEAQTLVTIPDFSVSPIQDKTMSIVAGTDRKATVNKAIDLLGGIERFIKPGDRVLIKPNVGFAKAPSLGATTNPELIAEVAKLCYARGGAKQVFVTDNPISDPESCFTLSGIGKAASGAGAKVMLPKDSYFKPLTLKDATLIKNWPILYEPLKGVNKIIGIAPIKDHRRSIASMSMKNWYGLLGGRRNIFHQDINTIIVELAMMVKPTLVILDGTEVMMTNGPTGGSITDLRRANTLIASCDQVAADAFGCTLLNLKPADVAYLAKAQTLGIGTADYQSLKPLMATIS
jgi:uncharacterized protein (DUF362 family)